MIARLLALAVVDAAVLGIGGATGIAPGWMLAVHGMLGAGAYALWLLRGERWGFAAAILGVLGPVPMMGGLAIDRLCRARAARSDDEIFGVPPRPRTQHGAVLAVARMLDGRVHHPAPETFGSLVTVMRHGDVGARRRALETVVRSFEPALSPLIALALTDGDQTIRALAAAASARVAENLSLARTRLTAQAADGADPQVAAALAALLADHARADVLLSDSQRSHLRDDAVAIAGKNGDAIRIEALWATGDYAAIDRLAEAMATDDAADAASWWHAEAAA